MNEGEIWKNITDYEDMYMVSNFGNVKSIERIITCETGRILPIRERIIMPYIKNKGTCFVIRLWKNNKVKHFYVARLVALAFISPVEGKPEVDHIDRNTQNNHVSNLRWADDFMQARNRQMVIDARNYSVSFESTRNRVSNWRVRWFEQNKGHSKHFKTKTEADTWAIENLTTRVLDKEPYRMRR